MSLSQWLTFVDAFEKAAVLNDLDTIVCEWNKVDQSNVNESLHHLLLRYFCDLEPAPFPIFQFIYTEFKKKMDHITSNLDQHERNMVIARATSKYMSKMFTDIPDRFFAKYIIDDFASSQNCSLLVYMFTKTLNDVDIVYRGRHLNGEDECHPGYVLDCVGFVMRHGTGKDVINTLVAAIGVCDISNSNQAIYKEVVTNTANVVALASRCSLSRLKRDFTIDMTKLVKKCLY